ncbi:MAG: energy transducer TonB [Candidatus Omnitrophica bacterium]|nr:energy transducer TonB [Candidatus Omnitrophota bacterium]
MNRMALALMLSAGFHIAVFAGSGLRLFHGPEVLISQGETRVALYLTPPIKEEPSPDAAAEHTSEPQEPPPSAYVPVEEGVVDTPPEYRLNFPPAYPREAFLKNIQGTTWILAEVDRKGRPAGVQVERSSGSVLLDEAARQAVSGWQFAPARRAGVAVSSRVRVPVHFEIIAGRPSGRLEE